VRGTVLYGPRDIRFEERTAPTIMKPTDAIIRITATYVCGSHLWPYRASTASRSPLFFIALRVALGDLIISGAASRAL
jgi:threonine dehydrogenase-like Zn-dependent dehydrogenase